MKSLLLNGRFASRCLATRTQSVLLPITPLNLQSLLPSEIRAVANLLPLLICGEESATFVFDDLAKTLESRLSPTLINALRSVTKDEVRHATYLEILRNGLPAPRDRLATQRAAIFLRVLKVTEPERQLARLAALDSAVCMILSALLHPAAPLNRAEDIARPLRRIQLDEAQHVRTTRACVKALGLSQAQAASERTMVLRAFASLLYPAATELRCLKVNLNDLVNRWKLTDKIMHTANYAVQHAAA